MILLIKTVLILLLNSAFILTLSESPVNITVDLDVKENINGSNSAILSRRKRFLIFPEGSSLQLVFCSTFEALSIGDVILWGYTAALAYELPQDPYSPFRHHADPLHRRMDTKVVYYTDEDGKIVYKKPYKKKLIVNPAFAKRSVDAESGAGASTIDRKHMHAASRRDFLDANTEFHRHSRAALFGKIETMLYGMGGNGRHCTLKTLCLVGQTRSAPQGGLLQEILRAVFTLPKGKFDDLYEAEYDAAHWTTKSCDELYPECNTPLSEPSFHNIL